MKSNFSNKTYKVIFTYPRYSITLSFGSDQSLFFFVLFRFQLYFYFLCILGLFSPDVMSAVFFVVNKTKQDIRYM